ncbi:MAG: Peptidylprolyl isomerase [uncultured Campylobacterales bacterium]|uniref:Peptidylprolyl isomerase n=1 Tax=uncultured Campylobacterales bacterium TaxID=352960 RepID=A0A6S6TAJ0_9BACT|nr:MAG: Peptidylprolyl isomerase [uncultured Campylobacterales bacterium]
MITWLQKNKKYTHIAIWISTIAFVGAGFVGWGAYDFNSNRANSVATVGGEKITLRDLQFSYNNLYSYYAQALGEKFNKEEAKKLNLEAIALQNLIDQAMVISIAKDFGLNVNDSEIRKDLASTKEFQTNSVFDKEKYYNLLKNSNISPKEYENTLKKQILTQKLINALETKPTKLEYNTLSAATSLEDKISIEIVKSDVDIEPKENETFKRWQKTKNLYLSLKSYSLDTYKINLDENLSENEIKDFYSKNKKDYGDYDISRELIKTDLAYDKTEKTAIKTYLKLKNGKIDFKSSATVDATSDFPMAKVQELKIGQVSKPIKVSSGYMVIKLNKINSASPLDYKSAKNLVIADLKKDILKETLKEKANEKLKNFKGKDVGYVSYSNYEIDGLSVTEGYELVKQIFSSNTKSGFKVYDDKSVIYKITDQRIASTDEKNEYLLNTQIQSIKASFLNKNLISLYKDKYKVNRFR